MELIAAAAAAKWSGGDGFEEECGDLPLVGLLAPPIAAAVEGKGREDGTREERELSGSLLMPVAVTGLTELEAKLEASSPTPSPIETNLVCDLTRLKCC